MTLTYVRNRKLLPFQYGSGINQTGSGLWSLAAKLLPLGLSLLGGQKGSGLRYRRKRIKTLLL